MYIQFYNISENEKFPLYNPLSLFISSKWERDGVRAYINYE